MIRTPPPSLAQIRAMAVRALNAAPVEDRHWFTRAIGSTNQK